MRVTIVQCRSRSKFSISALGIRLFQKTDYNHYAIEFRCNYYHSSSSGVHVTPLEEFRKKYKITSSFVCTRNFSGVEFENWFKQHEGKGYGFHQIAGLALKVLGIVKNNPFGRGAKRIICNELVILFLNKFCGTEIEDTDSLDLNDTEEIIRSLDCFKKEWPGV